MICKWCKEDELDCYVHCLESKDGNHVADLDTIKWVPGTDYVDISCSLCGKSGSAFVGEVNWD